MMTEDTYNKYTRLSQESLKEYVSYDPVTGQFTCIKKWCSKVMVGEVVGCYATGYWKVSFLGMPYLAHILAWFYMTGEWPKVEIDHKDRDKSNNQWGNLRQATRQQNEFNKSPHGDSILGIKGVSVSKNHDRYRAHITLDGKQYHLGTFDTLEEAKRARREAEQKFFGEFATTET